MEKLAQDLIDIFYSFLPRSAPSFEEIKKVKLVAHRGHQREGYKENTMDAFQSCVESGNWGMEFDIRWTSDNVPVVHHDPSCERIFSRSDVIIEETSSEKLREAIPEIPFFSEVVERFGKKIHLLIELKTLPTNEQKSILKNLLNELDPGADFHFLSLKTEVLDSLYDLHPNFRVAVALTNAEEMFNWAHSNPCAGLAGHYLLINDCFKKALETQGKKVGVGYITSKNSLYREISRRCEWIFTNHGRKIQKIVDSNP